MLIIYPHWPPCNLVGVQRPRLVANYLSSFDWHPIVLTVHPDYYEEKADWSLCKTVSNSVEVIHVKGWKVLRPRLFGDIGLRGFYFLYQQARRLLRERKIDFIWIPIPSYYTSLLGRLLNGKTNIPYGIDYIDPWVRNLRARKSLRNILSNLVARILEPIAIRKATLVTGVSDAYYMPALKRNFKASKIHQACINVKSSGLTQNREITHLAFPYGYDSRDHEIEPDRVDLPWKHIKKCKPLVYAGAFLPHSHLFVLALFKSIKQLSDEGDWDTDVCLFFLGTGHYRGKSIKSYAADFGIEHLVVEVRERFAFLTTLKFLSESFAVMVIGSIEKHYTASKVFQALCSERPVVAILHSESSAVQVLKETEADSYLAVWDKDKTDKMFLRDVKAVLKRILKNHTTWEPDYKMLEMKYSAKESARIFIQAVDELIPSKIV